MKQPNKILIGALILLIIFLGYLFLSQNKNDTVNTIQDISQEQNEQNEQSKQTEEKEKDAQNIINNTNQNKNMNATLHTNMGEITIEFNKDTPKTVENFVKLAESGFYDNTKFHRVIEGFMNQGGDPLSKDDKQRDYWGTGGPGYKFDDEITPSNANDTGTISMANAGPNTNGSQFFINTANNNFLDTKHTVFGKVTSGLDVVMKINAVATDPTDKPLSPVIINKITLK